MGTAVQVGGMGADSGLGAFKAARAQTTPLS